MYGFLSPAARAAFMDMKEQGINTLVFWKEDTILAFSGVYKKPDFRKLLSGQHQGNAFNKAYRKPLTPNNYEYQRNHREY